MKTVFLLLGLTFSINVLPQISDKFLSNFLNLNTPYTNRPISSNSKQNKNTVIELKDSTYTWDWNSSLVAWDYPSRIKYSYNSLNEKTGELYEHSSAENVWSKSSRYTDYVYDSRHNMLSNVNQNWIESQWKNSTKLNYTYDELNNNLSYMPQYWDEASMSWMNILRLNSTYNSSNKLLTKHLQIWNTNILDWENNYLGTATYNSSNENELVNYLEQNWSTELKKWVTTGQAINFIYENGDLTNLTWQGWNSTTLAFETTTRYIATYDGYHHILNELWQSRNKTTNTWINDYITYYNYDVNGNLIFRGGQTWNTTANKWDNYYEENYAYDLNNNQISRLLMYWQKSSSTYVNSYREENYYPDFTTGIVDKFIKSDDVLIYPNPVMNSFMISFSNSERKNAKVEIINDLGKIVQSDILGNELYLNKKISVSSLNSGIYFVRTTLGHKVYNSKIIVE